MFPNVSVLELFGSVCKQAGHVHGEARDYVNQRLVIKQTRSRGRSSATGNVDAPSRTGILRDGFAATSRNEPSSEVRMSPDTPAVQEGERGDYERTLGDPYSCRTQNLFPHQVLRTHLRAVRGRLSLVPDQPERMGARPVAPRHGIRHLIATACRRRTNKAARATGDRRSPVSYRRLSHRGGPGCQTAP